MTDTILVTGGTGDIGRRAVPLLQAPGREVRVLSRRGGRDVPGIRHVIGDTVANRGLDDAFAGAHTVLHLAGGPKGDDVAAEHVVAAARRAGVGHLVLVSVIGAGTLPLGYLRRKEAAERTLTDSGLPVTILRVSQLHSLLLPVIDRMLRLPIAPVPKGVRLEPIDGAAVADRLAELTVASPAGRVPDLAGPEVLDVEDLIRQVLDVRGSRRRLLRLPLPGRVGRAYRAGANLAGASAARAGRTWSSHVRDCRDAPAPARWPGTTP